MEYDLKYYENMMLHYSTTAETISRVRWDFVRELEPEVVLDYGCGCNFLTLYSPGDVIVDSFDIGRLNGVPYPQTGIRHERYDLTFFCDVLEHVDWERNPDRWIESALEKTDHVYISTPMIPQYVQWQDWKHYKPGEHLTYFSRESLIGFFIQRGFCIIKEGTPETDCGVRQDIYSAIFKKK